VHGDPAAGGVGEIGSGRPLERHGALTLALLR
jgi:hypothetical protein